MNILSRNHSDILEIFSSGILSWLLWISLWRLVSPIVFIVNIFCYLWNWQWCLLFEIRYSWYLCFHLLKIWYLRCQFLCLLEIIWTSSSWCLSCLLCEIVSTFSSVLWSLVFHLWNNRSLINLLCRLCEIIIVYSTTLFSLTNSLVPWYETCASYWRFYITSIKLII